MRAVVFDKVGPPDVLRVAELPDPVPGPGRLRVRVRAAGVQPFDTKVRSGTMSFVPLAFPQGIGQEFAGEVDLLGDGVETFDVGTGVLGSAMMSSCATHVVVDAANVVPKPVNLSFPQAAGLVSAAQTASGSLEDLKVGPGDVLLVHAAAGSVGTLATQLAVRAGASVIGTARPENHDYLRSLGATPVAYGPGLVDAVRALGVEVTVALDAVGGEAIAQSVQLGVPRDRIGTIVDDGATAEHGARVVRAGRSMRRLAAVAELGLTLPIREFAFDDVIAAHEAVESRRGPGKVVLTLP